MPLPSSDRDHYGRLVRLAWIRWAQSQPNPKPSWLVPYEKLTEPDKEADRQIADALWDAYGVDQLLAERDKLLATVERMAARA